MKLVFSFDDGRADNMRAVDEILVPRMLPATINITTGYVDGTISAEETPCPNEAMTVDDVRRLAASPFIELAGHGDMHQNTIRDLSAGLEKLRRWVSSDGQISDAGADTHGRETGTDGPLKLLSTDIIGIASPHSELTADEVEAHRAEYEAMGVEYVRIGPGASYSGINRVAGKLSRMTHSKGAFLKAYEDIDEHIEGGFALRSVPILHSHTPEQVMALIEKNRERGTDLLLMLHSILRPGEQYYDDTWSWDYDSFAALCDYCAAAEGVDVVTTQQALRGSLTRA